MRFLYSSAAILALASVSVPAAAQSGDPLRIQIGEGGDSVVPRNSAASRRISVTVLSAGDRPVPNATVTFRLPPEGPSGVFPSGLRTESLLTGPKGDAYIHGIRWNDTPGKVEVRLIATSGERRAEAVVPIEISATLAPTRADRESTTVRGPSSSRKWIILAIVAGGAGAGLAMAGGSRTAAGSAPPVYVPPAAVIVPPVLGAPAITIGRP
jgi:hypothetical protein